MHMHQHRSENEACRNGVGILVLAGGHHYRQQTVREHVGPANAVPLLYKVNDANPLWKGFQPPGEYVLASRQQYSNSSRIPGTCSAPKNVRFQYVESMSWRPFCSTMWVTDSGIRVCTGTEPQINALDPASQPAGRNPYVRARLVMKPVVLSYRSPLASTYSRQQYSNNS